MWAMRESGDGRRETGDEERCLALFFGGSSVVRDGFFRSNFPGRVFGDFRPQISLTSLSAPGVIKSNRDG